MSSPAIAGRLPGDGSVILAGRYRLQDPLGKGGTATVYRAWDETLEVERAVKLLTAAVSPTSTLGKRFLREARTMARLQHPHILMVADAGIEQEQPWMVMELLAGGSLRQVLDSQGPLPLDHAVSVTLALLAALEHAHHHDIVHRDVKPANILLDDRGLAKLADFGLARVDTRTTTLTRTGATMGTFAYMAPEQRIDASRADLRADLFGAGCTLFALLTGQDPFDLCMARSTDPRFNGVPASIAEVVLKSVAYKAGDRYLSAPEMAFALTTAYDVASDGYLPPLVLPSSPSLPPRCEDSGSFDRSRSGRSRREADTGPMRTDPFTGQATGPHTWCFDGEDRPVPQDPNPTLRQRISRLRDGVHDSVVKERPRLPQWLGTLIAASVGALAVLAFGGVSDPGVAVEPVPQTGAALSPAPTVAVAPPTQVEDPPVERAPVPVEDSAPAPGDPLAPTPEAGSSAGEETRRSGAPTQPAAAKTATLRVGSAPVATVYIDGSRKGTTPWRGEVPTGSRSVTLVTESGQSKSRAVRVKDGPPTWTCWDFEASSACAL